MRERASVWGPGGTRANLFAWKVREKFKCLQFKTKKKNLPENTLLLVIFLELFIICLSFIAKVNGKDECSVCGRKSSKEKAKITERFYEICSRNVKSAVLDQFKVVNLE